MARKKLFDFSLSLFAKKSACKLKSIHIFSGGSKGCGRDARPLSVQILFYRAQLCCGKVMFSQPSVILFTRGGACEAGGMCGRGACMAGACVAGETATAADGTHPTGMHTCFHAVSFKILHNNRLTHRFKELAPPWEILDSPLKHSSILVDLNSKYFEFIYFAHQIHCPRQKKIAHWGLR